MKEKFVPIEIDEGLFQYLQNKTEEWSLFTKDKRIVFTIADVIEGMIDELYFPGVVL